jgi:hypothetical protein
MDIKMNELKEALRRNIDWFFGHLQSFNSPSIEKCLHSVYEYVKLLEEEIKELKESKD